MQVDWDFRPVDLIELNKRSFTLKFTINHRLDSQDFLGKIIYNPLLYSLISEVICLCFNIFMLTNKTDSEIMFPLCKIKV